MPDLFRSVLIQHADRLAQLKGKYLRAYGEEKRRLERQIKDEESQLRDALRDSPAPRGALDWRIAFAEVFAEKQGFDIVLANPPYVRADAQFRHLQDKRERQKAVQRWKAYRKGLIKSGIYQTLYEKWDLYIPFLERAYQTLR
jgi:hypothetical protein